MGWLGFYTWTGRLPEETVGLTAAQRGPCSLNFFKKIGAQLPGEILQGVVRCSVGAIQLSLTASWDPCSVVL